MNAVITVIGKDMVGILAKVATTCAESNANVIEVTQNVLKDYFAMIMLVELDGLTLDFAGFAEAMKSAGKDAGVEISVMHEDIFNSMHRI